MDRVCTHCIRSLSFCGFFLRVDCECGCPPPCARLAGEWARTLPGQRERERLFTPTPFCSLLNSALPPPIIALSEEKCAWQHCLREHCHCWDESLFLTRPITLVSSSSPGLSSSRLHPPTSHWNVYHCSNGGFIFSDPSPPPLSFFSWKPFGCSWLEGKVWLKSQENSLDPRWVSISEH